MAIDIVRMHLQWSQLYSESNSLLLRSISLMTHLNNTDMMNYMINNNCYDII